MAIYPTQILDVRTLSSINVDLDPVFYYANYVSSKHSAEEKKNAS